ncbi:TerC family protein [Rhodoligotrophos defluvii]|uniref:TerC family protein n=1 Tax=Rhodoligotrophos defluvii TaxID=2561934 RepID=UPI0010C978E3|nr:TerC family protein [Rhodoligotrophos defluvii]
MDFNFDWISDPTAWLGLGTLIVLEIVLGIDNLIFIAILADKLPRDERDKARLVGLSLALLMRLGLLAGISWMVTLTRPLFTIFGFGLSGRDLILIVGGLFLLFKATTELHERLEGDHGEERKTPVRAKLWQVIVQIIVLDAVFSLDSVITAVGMVNHLSIMMIAVIIAVVLMMLASRPLMNFVSAHPTVVILCLGFLLMIGFSLVVEGLGFHIPKGYLYAAIGFSVLIEAFNQLARRNKMRLATTINVRDRTAAAVLRLLGGGKPEPDADAELAALASTGNVEELFGPEERSMVQGVMTLGERPVRTIMTPRTEVIWLDPSSPQEELKRKILDSGRSRFPIAHSDIDNVVGIALAKDLLSAIVNKGEIDLERAMREPLIVHDRMNVLQVMEQLRDSPVQLAMVFDEYGSLEGVVTPTDVLEAITGGFPEEGEIGPRFETEPDGSWLVDGQTDIHRLSQVLDVDLTDEDDRYSTLAGFLLWQVGYLPKQGEKISAEGFDFEIVEMDGGRRIGLVRIRRIPEPE